MADQYSYPYGHIDYTYKLQRLQTGLRKDFIVKIKLWPLQYENNIYKMLTATSSGCPFQLFSINYLIPNYDKNKTFLKS